MKNDARSLSTDEKYFLRRIAIQRVLDGESAAEVARSYELGACTIYVWLRKYREGGFEALSPIPRTGRNRKLSESEEQEVKRWVLSGDPRQYGFEFALWTRQIISDLILDRFGVELSLTSTGELLHRLDLTPQKPLRRAYERDEEAVADWKENEYPKIVKKAKKIGAEIFWLDEASIRSDDPLQRTWGLKGQTPVVKTSGQRQRISAISALSNSGGFWYHVYSGTLTADKFIDCLRDFMKGKKKPIFMIMDGHPVHKSKKVKEFVDGFGGNLQIFLLPPYAPDLNPDELVWNQMRNMGTSKKPLKKGETLFTRVVTDLELIKQDKSLIKSFFLQESVFFAAA